MEDIHYPRNRNYESESTDSRSTRKIRLPVTTADELFSSSDVFRAFFPQKATSVVPGQSLINDNPTPNFQALLEGDHPSVVDASLVVSTKFSPLTGQEVLDGECIMTGVLDPTTNRYEFTILANFKDGKLHGDYVILGHPDDFEHGHEEEVDHLLYDKGVAITHIWYGEYMNTTYLSFKGYHNLVGYTGSLLAKYPIFDWRNKDWGTKVMTFLNLVALNQF